MHTRISSRHLPRLEDHLCDANGSHHISPFEPHRIQGGYHKPPKHHRSYHTLCLRSNTSSPCNPFLHRLLVPLELNSRARLVRSEMQSVLPSVLPLDCRSRIFSHHHPRLEDHLYGANGNHHISLFGRHRIQGGCHKPPKHHPSYHTLCLRSNTLSPCNPFLHHLGVSLELNKHASLLLMPRSPPRGTARPSSFS